MSPELQALLGPILAALATGLPVAYAAVRELRASADALVRAVQGNTDAVNLQAQETRHLRNSLERAYSLRPDDTDRATWPPEWAGPSVRQTPPTIRAATARRPS